MVPQVDTQDPVVSSLKRAIARMENLTLKNKRSQKRNRHKKSRLESREVGEAKAGESDVEMVVHNEILYCLCKEGILMETLDHMFSVIREKFILTWYRRLTTRSLIRYVFHIYGNIWVWVLNHARKDFGLGDKRKRQRESALNLLLDINRGETLLKE